MNGGVHGVHGGVYGVHGVHGGVHGVHGVHGGVQTCPIHCLVRGSRHYYSHRSYIIFEYILTINHSSYVDK